MLVTVPNAVSGVAAWITPLKLIPLRVELVNETVPPPGFQLPGTVTQSYTIPVGTAGATIISFVDPLAPGSITIEKTAPAGSQSTVFHFTITCTGPSNTYHVQVMGTGSVTQSITTPSVAKKTSSWSVRNTHEGALDSCTQTATRAPAPAAAA